MGTCLKSIMFRFVEQSGVGNITENFAKVKDYMISIWIRSFKLLTRWTSTVVLRNSSSHGFCALNLSMFFITVQDVVPVKMVHNCAVDGMFH
jgi:hypothetical protein